MALLHQAQISPTKLELLTAWVPTQSWSGAGGELSIVAACRLDDPAGEVGIEVFVVAVGGVVLHAPLTYRDAPLAGVDEISTMTHTVLGDRWVYDAATDPVFLEVLRETILTGGGQAEEWVQGADGERALREPRLRLAGSGEDGGDPVVLRVVEPAAGSTGPRLTATWDGGSGVIARLSPR